MIEIDSDRILCHFTYYARHFIAVTTAEQHDGADIRHPCFLEITTRDELHQIRAFGTESRFRGQRESMLVPNAQSGQLIFQRVRQAAVAEAKQRRFSIGAGRFCRRAIFKLQRKMYQHGAVVFHLLRHISYPLVFAASLGFARKPSSTTSTAPTQIKLSARLKIG